MANIMPCTHIGTHVLLLNTKKHCIGIKYLSTLKAGEVLHTRVLREDEVVVSVNNVFDNTYKVEEPFQDCLDKCEHKLIQ